MKSMIIVALALVAVAAALPVDEPVPIISSNFDQQPNGNYASSYETGNGIKASEVGEVKEVRDEENKPVNVVVVRGSFTYTNPDGEVETINYEADENGFRAEGPSVPKVPVARR